jgi:CRP-like cAMP-binding protein
VKHEPPRGGPVNNGLLRALPRDEFERLAPHLEPSRLTKGKILTEVGDPIRYVYFLCGGMVSLLSITEHGETVEIGTVGHEGAVGLPASQRAKRAPYRAVIQIPSDSLRVGAETLCREFKRGGELQALLLSYTHVLVTQITQSVACNRFHTVEQRLARWLLMSRDRVGSSTFRFTQEDLSQVLGVPRNGVGVAVGALRRKKLIGHARGQITILEQAGLESASCECYRIVRDEIGSALPA